jgi:hypothetical protein
VDSLIRSCDRRLSFVGRRFARAILLAVGATAVALPAGAQSPVRRPALTGAWTLDMAGGVLSRPTHDGGTGPALSVTIARRLGGSSIRLVGVAAAARLADVDAERPDRYVMDEDWGITGFGAEAAWLTIRRMEFGLGGKAAVLWSRVRWVGTVGTPVGPAPSRRVGDWELKAGAILGAHAIYHASEAIAVITRAAMVQHVFTDNLIGPTGGLFSIGAGVSW